MKQPITLYLIGFPGAGKYTIAKELAKFGYKIIDNHLINNPIFSLLDLDGVRPIPDKAWAAIGKIRESVFHFIAQHPLANYVFTNVLLEDKGDHTFYDHMLKEVEKRGSLLIPIKLHISPHEHERRIKSAERKEKFKATSFSIQDKNKGLIQINHPYLFELDVTNLSAHQAAFTILDFVKNRKIPEKPASGDKPIIIRPATTADIPHMVSLSAQKRRDYEKVQPQFWKHAESAEEAQEKWFVFLMSRGIGIFLVAEEQNQIVGFIRGQLENAPEVYDPGGATLMIDDFHVEKNHLWPTVGQQLLHEVKTHAKQKGTSQVVVVSGHHDEPKRQFLKSEGLKIASEWFVGGMNLD